MIIDGKKIAEDIVVEIGTTLNNATLGMVVGSTDAATESFIKIKARVAGRLGVHVVRGTWAEVAGCDAIIVQLPHPDADRLLAALPGTKDVDAMGLHPVVRPPVAGAIGEILKRASVDPRGKHAVVVGAGKLVGLPAAALLRDLGAEVSVITRGERLDGLKSADIVVCGAGEPGLITPSMLKEGVVLMDAGTSEAAGKLAGDADPACANIASVFTPVPGGVGPIAVAMIFKNMAELVHRGRVAQ